MLKFCFSRRTGIYWCSFRGAKKNIRALSKSRFVACHPFRSLRPGRFGQIGGTHVQLVPLPPASAALVPCGQHRRNRVERLCVFAAMGLPQVVTLTVVVAIAAALFLLARHPAARA